MDFVAVLAFILPALVIGYLIANGETSGGLGCLGTWVAVMFLVGLGMEGASASETFLIAMIASVLPAVGAGVGYAIHRQREGDRKAMIRRSRRVIPASAKSLGMLWYGGGAPDFECIMAEVFLTPLDVWLASFDPPNQRPFHIPLKLIEGIEVRTDVDVSTRTDIVGGAVWGGGGARRTESIRDPKLLIRWRTKSNQVHEVELRTNSPLPSSAEENRKASQLGTNVDEVRRIKAAITEALPKRSAAFAPSEPAEEPGVSDTSPPADESATQRRACPWCAESIMSAAKICRYCNREIESGKLAG